MYIKTLYGHQIQNEESYKEAEEYLSMSLIPSIERLCDRIMEIYNNTIGSGACIIDTIQRGKHNHLIVTDEFKNNYYNQLVELKNKIKEYISIAGEEVNNICKKYCKYGDGKCHNKYFNCRCVHKQDGHGFNCDRDNCICKNRPKKYCDSCLMKNRYNCDCDFYYISVQDSYLSIYYATRKKFHGISFEKDRIKIFHFTFI